MNHGNVTISVQLSRLQPRQESRYWQEWVERFLKATRRIVGHFARKYRLHAYEVEELESLALLQLCKTVHSGWRHGRRRFDPELAVRRALCQYFEDKHRQPLSLDLLLERGKGWRQAELAVDTSGGRVEFTEADFAQAAQVFARGATLTEVGQLLGLDAEEVRQRLAQVRHRFLSKAGGRLPQWRWLANTRPEVWAEIAGHVRA